VALADLERRATETLLLPKTNVLIVEGSRVRFEQEGPHAGLQPGTQVPSKHLAVFDGANTTEYWPSGESPYPLADVTNGDSTHGLAYVGSRPIVLAYRGADRIKTCLSGMDERAFRTFRRGIIDGRECIIVENAGGGHSHRAEESLWLDLSRDYSVARIVRSMKGKLRLQVDISSESHGENEWVPAAWKSSFWSPEGKLIRTVAAEVIDYALNSVVPERTFRLELAPGTLVRDMRPQQATSYIIRDDGTKRFVTENEWQSGLTYDEMLASNGQRRGARWVFFVMNAAVVVLLCVIILVGRLWRARSVSP